MDWTEMRVCSIYEQGGAGSVLISVLNLAVKVEE